MRTRKIIKMCENISKKSGVKYRKGEMRTRKRGKMCENIGKKQFCRVSPPAGWSPAYHPSSTRPSPPPRQK